MYIMCLIIFEEKAEVQDQYPLSLNPVQKANDQCYFNARISITTATATPGKRSFFQDHQDFLSELEPSILQRGDP